MSTELVFPWGQVIVYFLWILGLAVILADFSYFDFISRKKNLAWKDILKRDDFLRPLHLGGILILVGVGGALHDPMLAAVCWAGGFALGVWFVRKYRRRRKKKR